MTMAFHLVASLALMMAVVMVDSLESWLVDVLVEKKGAL